MRELGFTDHRKGVWYMGTPVERYLSFDITIDKNTGEVQTLVIDENFGQPVPYQRHTDAAAIRARIDMLLEWLHHEGLRVEHDHSEYE